MLSATCIKGVEIVGMPVEPQLLVSCRVILGILGVSMLQIHFLTTFDARRRASAQEVQIRLLKMFCRSASGVLPANTVEQPIGKGAYKLCIF